MNSKVVCKRSINKTVKTAAITTLVASSPTAASFSTGSKETAIPDFSKYRYIPSSPAHKITRVKHIDSPGMIPHAERSISSTVLMASKKQGQTEETQEIKRTNSFEPVWAGTFDPNTSVKVHTLICGTHPSITSLGKSQYFAHPMNVFWWIVGDCLGFRRSSGVSEKSGKEYAMSSELRYGVDKIIPYEEQLKVFTDHGFALWDVVKSCERKGSLDMDIKKEEPNDLREFCQQHQTSLRRIVLANGSTQCTIFNRHFQDWWRSGELKPASNENSIRNFKKYAKFTNNFEDAQIECVCAIAVSPAAAKYTYNEKRAFWEEYCFKPGLLDHKSIN